MCVQLLANVGLLATRWRLKTQSCFGDVGMRDSRSSGPWATIARGGRASSPNFASPTRSSPTIVHGPHVAHTARTITDHDSAPQAASTHNRSCAAASMCASNASQKARRSELSQCTGDSSRSALNGRDNGDESTSISSVSSAAPPSSLATSLAPLPLVSRCMVPAGTSAWKSSVSYGAAASNPLPAEAICDDTPNGTMSYEIVATNTIIRLKMTH
jgi:hypothetical protein